MAQTAKHKNPFPRIHEVHNKSSSPSKQGNYKVSGELTTAWLKVLSRKVEKHGTG